MNLAEHKFLTGIFDNISKENKQNYVEEIFEICGYKFNGEKYLIDIEKDYDKDWTIDSNKKVIGLKYRLRGKMDIKTMEK